MESKILNQEAKNRLAAVIRAIPDYPKPGILFRDITTLLNDKSAFCLLLEHLKARYLGYKLDFIAGIESRGFIFGGALAYALGIGFVPIRKKGKLPATTISQKYSLEYGFSEIEIHIDAFASKDKPKVLLIDDLIATGGTALAAASLIESAGGECVEACFVVDLPALGGAELVGKQTPVYSVLEY